MCGNIFIYFSRNAGIKSNVFSASVDSLLYVYIE